MLGLYYCSSFSGLYPTNQHAVIIARHRGHALKLLVEKLKEENLFFGKNEHLTMDDIKALDFVPGVVVFNDGDY